MDLNAPLGLEPPPRPGGPRRLVLPALSLLGAGIVGLGTYYLATADPRGSEPYAVARIPSAPPRTIPPSPPAALSDPMPTGSVSASSGQANSVRVENGVKVVSSFAAEQAGGNSPAPLVIDVSKALEGRTRSAALAAGSGAKPSNSLAIPAMARPRVAILVGGLGLSEGPTATAIESLPGAVDLAFVANDATMATTIASARAKGHEILLQLPMQSARGTMSGTHTLRTTETSAELAQDVKWLLTRFDGYAGVTNLLGAPVTANRAAMTSVLKSVASRGVPYIDDGTSSRSLAAPIGSSLGLPTLQADVVLDATSDPAVVDANLERLLTIARTKGAAIGTASALSDHLGTIGRFARQLDARGFVLVPVTAIAGGAKTATNR